VLEVDQCEISPDGARWLAKAPFMATLRRLNTNSNNFGTEGLLALLEARPACLHSLDMIDNDLDDEAASHIAESPASDTLQELHLSRNGLGDHAAEALAASEHLPNLLILSLRYNPITKPAESALKRSPLGKRLAALYFQDEGSFPF
jgi:hypothetical protein